MQKNGHVILWWNLGNRELECMKILPMPYDRLLTMIFIAGRYCFRGSRIPLEVTRIDQGSQNKVMPAKCL